MRFLVGLTLLTCLFIGACQDQVVGSGEIIVEERQLATFDQVEIKDIINAKIHLGVEAKVEVTADDNLMPKLLTEVKEGVLIVSFDEQADSYENTTLQLDITIPTISRLVHNSIGEVQAEGLVLSDSLVVVQSGIGDLILSGAVPKLSIEKTGTGLLSAFDMLATNCLVQQDGIGGIMLQASDVLTGSLTGTGDIQYRGRPALQVSVTGFGQLIDAN